MSITWVPIDQCPEEWKKSGKEVFGMRDQPEVIGPYKMFWNDYKNKWQGIGTSCIPTHLAEIPPELRPENIGLGKRVSVKMMGNSRWVLDSNDHTATIIKMERDYSVSKYVCAHPCSNEILWKELGTYPTLQAAIDAFEETLL